MQFASSADLHDLECCSALTHHNTVTLPSRFLTRLPLTRLLHFCHIPSLLCSFALHSHTTTPSHKLQEAEEERLRQEFIKQGIHVPKKQRSEIFDSNTITPGTPFMHRLSIALQYYVHLRLNSDPGWRDIEVRLRVWA